VLAATLRSLAGLRLTDDDGDEHVLELLPPASDAELRAIEAATPCPLRVSKGLANGPLESFSLVDLVGFGLDEAFPHAYSIAHDGFGLGAASAPAPDPKSGRGSRLGCHPARSEAGLPSTDLPQAMIIDYETITAGSGGGMLMVSASGTAVVLE
jgi:hypothetical protein